MNKISKLMSLVAVSVAACMGVTVAKQSSMGKPMMAL